MAVAHRPLRLVLEESGNFAVYPRENPPVLQAPMHLSHVLGRDFKAFCFHLFHDPVHIKHSYTACRFAEEPYEFSPAKGGIVFPTGLGIRNETILIYYGAADGSVCLATADVNLLRSFGDEVRHTLAAQN